MQFSWFPTSLRYLLYLLLSFVITASFSVHTNTSIGHQKVIVSISVPWEPYSYFDKSGELIGTDISLLRKTVAGMEQSLAYVPNIPLKRLAKSGGKLGFNTVLAATYTKERAKKNYFSIPYRTEKIGVFVAKPNYLSHKNIEQMLSAGLIGSLNESAFYGEEFERIKDKYSKQLYHSESVRRRVKKLMGGRIDFIVNDVETMQYAIDTQGLKGIHQAPFLIVESPVRFMFLKSEFSPNFVSEFNLALASALKTD